MKNSLDRRKFLRMVCGMAVLCAASSLVGCGKDKKELVLGDWYLEGSDRLRFTIYDDGTVNIPGTYGTGKWSIVNDDQLKIADFYGETTIFKIEDIDEKSMTVRQVWNGQESEETSSFYHTAEEATKH